MRSDHTRLSRIAAAGAIPREERRLLGNVGGALYVMGGLTLVLLAVLPGVTHAHSLVLFGLAGLACACGLVSIYAIDWDGAPGWAPIPAYLIGLGTIAVAMASSGGADSPAWVFLFLTVVLAAYFFGRPLAYLAFLACIATHASVVLYDPRALHGAFPAQFALAVAAYAVVGGAIVAGKRRMCALRHRAERLAVQQGALRRVAIAVARGEPAEHIYELVAFEVARLLEGGAAGIMRLHSPELAVVIGSWASHAGGRYEPGRDVAIRAGGDIESALRTGRPVRIERHPPGSPVNRLGFTSSIVAPIRVAEEMWGVLAVAALQPAWFTAEDEQHLMQFSELLATAIESLEDRAKLSAQALTDPLTGLANHRALQQRLSAEVARAIRHHSPLSVAVLDVDHFKQINDSGGHETGDETLVCVARCLTELARAEDTLGRVGGDEFAWVLPDTTAEQALVAIERARRMIGVSVRRPYRITVSAGVCDLAASSDPAQLLRLADGALYWSKAHGRNRCWIYDPAIISDLSAGERAERLERSQALAGLRALARAIDAKDPATSRHSERVAELVGKLARSAGWSPERAGLLSEAALVHDVGKVGVPDSVLFKPGPLTAEERKQVETHAELTARIVADVLAAEQVEWIRTHHERPDGLGYPRSLRGHEIPEGAALLTAADCWDVMTVSRPYSLPKTSVPYSLPKTSGPYSLRKTGDEALAECIGLVGRQFTKTAVAALAQLHAAGELGAEPGGDVPVAGIAG